MMTASIKTVQDALNAHDAQKYAAVFATDGVQKEAGMPDAAGREAIAARMQQIFTTFPDFRFAFSRAWQKGSIGISTWSWNGTDTGGFMGAKPTGRTCGLEGATVAVYNDDGTLKELRVYTNDGTLMLQLDPKAKKGTFRGPPALATSVDVVAATPDDDKNLDVIKPFYQGLQDKNEAAVLAFATEDTVMEDYSAPVTLKGVKDVKGMYKGYTTAFPDAKELPLTNQWAIGGYVISEGTLNATHKGQVGPFRATGKPVSLHFLDIAQVKNGKIPRFWTWSNGVEFMTQIGAIKPPGATPPAATAPAPAPAPATKAK
jgi:predicted ester cyclase